MSVKPIPEGYQSVIPYLVGHNIEGLIEFLEKVFNEAFNFKLSLRFIRNPNMAANGRFPTAVGDFKYEINN